MNSGGFIQDNFSIFQASHEGSWAILAILFLVAYFLFRGGKSKAGTIIHMIARLFFVIMLVTGASMLIAYQFAYFFFIKGLLAVLLIGFMEAALGKAKRNENSLGMLFAVLVVLVVIVLMGYGIIRF
ncbi:hypothetical protein J26TS2_16930 [Shouchella clausii]|uniref:YisL family protein n=1 Tax=Shouchella tritolerans TaxID=2979466 RepID=UPI0007869509|nr:YisL family protein [Shouchella tritolerans]GIN11826.1 hypothetical protein J26TS2_16930 [Shouchella clausii]